MDSYEATGIVFSRIQTLDPENASKIIGILLLQDHGEKEMIRLAFGPEALLHSVILKARKELGLLPSNNSPPTPTTPSPPSPFISRQSSTTSMLLGPVPPALIIPNSSSSSSDSSAWSSSLSELPTPDELISPSSSLNPSSLPFYGSGAARSDMIDELQLQDRLSLIMDNNNPNNQDLFYPRTELCSSPNNTDMGFPSYWSPNSSLHRRSCSVNDVLGLSDSGSDPSSGLGWRPCLYFARGYCKNGTSCRFIHGGVKDSIGLTTENGSVVGSPSKIEMMEQCHELLRSKSAVQQQHRLAAAASQLMASAASFPYSPKATNLFVQQQQQNDSQRAAAAAAAAAALMMGDEMYKFGRSRLERNGFPMSGDINPASRQIYLTFPADSTFREEDVSNYFSIYGPVQDVRIPYQQKRMFGFVTFVYPETVKIILAKGNPHFVCDARVLVKPYKEKGKVPDKYRKQQQQQVERGEFSPCGTPTGPDSRDPFDLQIGGRMFYSSSQDMWRRKLEEQADLQQALELQSRRLMGLQLLDVKKNHHHITLSTGSPAPSPTHMRSPFNQSLVLPSFLTGQEFPQGSCSSSAPAISITPEKKQLVNAALIAGNADNGRGKGSPECKDEDLAESLEHNLPDSPFASSTRGSGDCLGFINVSEDLKDVSANNSLVSSTLHPANNSLDMASFKSYNCQIPSFSSGHGAIGMYTGAGGPTCPVGI